MPVERTASADRKHRFGADFTRRIASFFRPKQSPSRPTARPKSENPPGQRRSRRPSFRNEQTPRSLRFKLFSSPTHPKEPVSFSVPSSHLRDGTITDALPSYLRSKESHHELDYAPRSAPSRAFQISKIPGVPNSRSKRASSDNRSANAIPQPQSIGVEAFASSADSLKAIPKYHRPRPARVIPNNSSISVPEPYRPKEHTPRSRSTLPPADPSTPTVPANPANSLQLRFDADRKIVTHGQTGEPPNAADPSGNQTTSTKSDPSDRVRPFPKKSQQLETQLVRPNTPTLHPPNQSSLPSIDVETASQDSTPRGNEAKIQLPLSRAVHDLESHTKKANHITEIGKSEEMHQGMRHRTSELRNIAESHKVSDGDTDGDDASSMSSAPTCTFTTPTLARSAVVSKKDSGFVGTANTSFSSPVEEYRALSLQGEQAAQALERISRIISDFDEGGDEKGKEAVIPILMEAINQYRQDPLVADRALTTLRRFTVSPKCRRALGESGAVETIATIMNMHNLRVRIAAQGCLALGNLCYHEDANKERVLEHGITVIVAAMALHTEAEQTQAWGALALRNCTNSLDEEAEGPLGAVEVLVAAVETYMKSEVVVSNALAALGNIARTKGKDAIVQAGGVSVLLSTLKANSHNQRLTELGLSLCVGVIEDDAMCAFFGSQGGVEVITNILDYHRGDAAISCLGSAVLRVLAFNAQNRKRFANCGTLRAVVSALNTVATEEAPSKVNIVMKALANIVFDSSWMKIEAGKLRVIEISMSVMLRLSQSELVAEAGMRVIRNLTDQNKENGAVLVGHPQGLANIAWIGRTHGTSSAGVAEHTIACLVNLAVIRRFAAVIRADAKIGALVQDLQIVHANNRRVVTQATKLRGILEGGQRPKALARD